MIGLDSYSRQVFYLFGPHFDLYQSLNRLPISNSQNCSMFPLAFVAGWLQGHWWGFISRNYVVWPTFFLMNVFIALKGSHFWFYIWHKNTKYSFMLTPVWYEVVIGRNVTYTLCSFPFTIVWENSLCHQLRRSRGSILVSGCVPVHVSIRHTFWCMLYLMNCAC